MRTHNNYTVYSCGVLLGIIGLIAISVIKKGGWLTSYFVTDMTNSYMDFFNIIAKAYNTNPYITRNTNYPALVWLIAKAFQAIIPPFDGQSDGIMLRQYLPCQLLFIGYIIFVLWVVCTCIRKICLFDAGNSDFAFFLLMIVTSGPMLFAIERGNFVLLSLAFTMFFIAEYDSDRFWGRVFAYMSLALAFSIKIYPALFGILILKKKRFSESVLAIVIAMIAFFTPFVFFGGSNAFFRMLNGISNAGVKQAVRGTNANFSLYNFADIIRVTTNENVYFSKLAIIVILFVCLMFAIVANELWKSLFLIALVCIWGPSFSYTYTLIFFIPAVVVFLRDADLNRLRDAIYITNFIIILSPIVTKHIERIDNGLSYPLSYSTLIINLALLFMAIMVIVDIGYEVFHSICLNNRKSTL